MGTPEFSVVALEAIIKAGHEVAAVYTREPKPAGRGQKEQKSPVHIIADKYNIPVTTPKTLKNQDVQAEFAAFGADCAVVAAYGLILPKPILDACPCINIHASLLPRWRGAAPIQRAILAGDKESGITIMHMDEGLDTGDMLLWEKVAIDGMNAGQLHDTLAKMGGKLIVEAMNNPKLQPVKQDGWATYAEKICKEEAKINWNNTVEEIDRQIRAFNPYPGAYFVYNGEKIKILAAQITKKSVEKPAIIMDSLCGISCSNGVVYPKIVQRQGKKPMPIEDMLRGFEIQQGITL
ncbi:MAG: fmt [Rickettsiaceae bacterium]|nr:fmt [Rickettsiaceae bacterium]